MPESETAPPEPAPPPLPAELEPAQQALDRGNFRQARTFIATVLAANPPADVAAAAIELRRATENDPWAVRFGLAAVALLALVVGAYIL